MNWTDDIEIFVPLEEIRFASAVHDNVRVMTWHFQFIKVFCEIQRGASEEFANALNRRLHTLYRLTG